MGEAAMTPILHLWFIYYALTGSTPAQLPIVHGYTTRDECEQAITRIEGFYKAYGGNGSTHFTCHYEGI
jgi:hypothetical protein